MRGPGAGVLGTTGGGTMICPKCGNKRMTPDRIFAGNGSSRCVMLRLAAGMPGWFRAGCVIQLAADIGLMVMIHRCARCRR